MNFSSKDRAKNVIACENHHYDLIVIGGGVTGAGIALDAATRGLKVALFEKEDFGAGTSSKSSKLIHGGLRYLKQLEFKLVHEVGSERAIVHRIAPHLVHPEKMLMPLIKGGTYGKWGTMLGLSVYDFLANVKRDDRRKMLSAYATLQEEPLLDASTLKGGALYAEYRTDDARLTLELIKTAVLNGAHCFNYTQVEDFLYTHDKVSGVKVRDTQEKVSIEVQGRYVVSAAGPWVDDLRKKDNEIKGKKLFLSKGVHIVVPRERLPIQHTMYFDVPDGRMMFAVRRHRVTYIGTSDTKFEGDKNHVIATSDDVKYILEGANAMFPTAHLTTADVESTWAGLRPLIYEEGKSGAEMSRKDEIFMAKSGLISIAGGKLTGYRKMAQRIVDLVATRLEKEYQKKISGSKTVKVPLTGGPFGHYNEVKAYIETLNERLDHLDLTDIGYYLTANYGKQTEQICKNLHLSNSSTAMVDLALAEAAWAIENEMAMTALDFFDRRTGRLYFWLPSIHEVVMPVLKTMASLLGWSSDRLETEHASVLKSVHELSTFEDLLSPHLV